MDARTFDWKDVANSKFDKAFTLALLVLLLAILVTPKVDIKRQKFAIQESQIIDIPPEQREKIEQPENIAKPVVELVISDELATDDASDPEAVEQLLEILGGDIYTTTGGISSSESDKPFNPEIYEEAPEPINPIAPEYPDFAKNTGIQGLVYLEVDVFKDGSIGEIKVLKSLLSGPHGLDQAAVNAVKRWKFQPGKNGGKPIDTRVIIPIEFTIN